MKKTVFEITIQDAPVSSTPAPRRIQHGGRPNWKEDGSREVGNGAGKYSGLTRLAYHYNRQFSASQHHAYGCNCMMVGGLPLVDTNFGPPGIGSLFLSTASTVRKIKSGCREVISHY